MELESYNARPLGELSTPPPLEDVLSRMELESCSVTLLCSVATPPPRSVAVLPLMVLESYSARRPYQSSETPPPICPVLSRMELESRRMSLARWTTLPSTFPRSTTPPPWARVRSSGTVLRRMELEPDNRRV